MGSKARFCKEILAIMLQDRKPDQWYVEPFAGGMNVICQVEGKRIANDNNKYLIEMWKGLTSGASYPKEISRELYVEARNSYNQSKKGAPDTMPPDLVGWIGWMASANGRFFDGGYAGSSYTETGDVRPYVRTAVDNIAKQVPAMCGVVFESKDYTKLEIPPNSLVYCDIPYKDTKQYSTSKGFSHDEFWEWASQLAAFGHTVFVSEYTAPAGFTSVWEKESKCTLAANGTYDGNTTKVSVEKLFKLSN
jgi:DNA adenine methylase